MISTKAWKVFSSALALAVVLAVSTLLSPAASAYDGNAAATYADTWATSRNGAYPDFGPDCTNFVSQALSAGSFPMRGGTDAQNPNEWWIRTNIWNTWDYATTWSVAARLRQFMINIYPGGISKGTAYGEGAGTYTPVGEITGDLIVMDWGRGEGLSHAAIQVGTGVDPVKSMYGNLIDQHTNDHYHAIWNLKPYNLDYKTTTFYFEHIQANN